jgi:membrane protease YdiL (CAAX protease family)
MNSRSRIWLFMALIFIFFALGSVLAAVVCMKFYHCSFEEIPAVVAALPNGVAAGLMWMNNVSQVATFLLPVLLFYVLVGKPSQHGLLVKSFNVWVLLSPIIILTSSGLIDLAAYLNEAMIPQGSWLESVFKPQEESATQLTEQILRATDASSWLIYLSIAIVPAICEEMLFRGLLQPLLSSIYRNHHVGIWMTAFVFSLIHFQFYGFIPRLLLGAVLGYLMVWTGSLWSSIIAHGVNNATAILVFSAFGSTTPPDDSWLTSTYTLLGSVVVFVGLIYLLHSKRKATSVEQLYASSGPPQAESLPVS